MVWNVLLFLVGFALLIKGGDWFVDGASGVAHRFRVPELLIGATVVSIGTTLPEVMVSSISAVEGVGGVAYGNAVGSVICNTALISALTIAIRPPEVEKSTFRTPVAFFFLAAAVYLAAAYLFSFTRVVGVILLLIFALYMVLIVLQAKKEMRSGLTASAPPAGEAPAADPSEGGETKQSPAWKDILLLVIGAALIAVGAKLLVDNGTKIAAALGVPDSVIGLTFVALGTSLPELVTAVTALVKGHGALSLGNIVGANLFNLVLVSGLATTLSPFALPAEKTIGGVNASLVVDLPVMVLVMALLTLPALVRGKLSRVQGIVLLAVYAAFTAFQFVY